MANNVINHPGELSNSEIVYYVDPWQNLYFEVEKYLNLLKFRNIKIIGVCTTNICIVLLERINGNYKLYFIKKSVHIFVDFLNQLK